MLQFVISKLAPPRDDFLRSRSPPGGIVMALKRVVVVGIVDFGDHQVARARSDK